MVVQLPIPFEQLVELIEQLPDEQSHNLIERLTSRQEQRRPSKTLRVFHVDHFPESVTLRREDEYGDDER